jgi:uncharacterized protein
MRWVTACCSLVLLAAVPAEAGNTLQEGAARTAAGLTALEAGDATTAARELELGARAGNRLAAYTLAMVLFADHPGTADEQAAWRWLRRAVTAGLPEAQLAFAQLYDQGRRVAPSPPTALHYYRLAAEQGLVDAQVSLGTLYFLGQGTAQDYAQAARWFLAAAEGGHPGAQYLIAHMFEEGYGVPRDLDQARRWYAAAARQGDPLAASRLDALALPAR